MTKRISLNLHERKMLLEAARSFKQADKDAIAMGYADAETVRRWNVIIRKLRGKK